MTFFASPAFFSRVLRIAALLFLLLPGISPSALAALPRNSEISIIMKERAAVEQNLTSLKRQLQEYQAKLQSTSRKESQSFKVLENIRTQILVLEKMIAENQNYLKKLDGDIVRLRHELQGNRQIYGRVSDDFRRTAVSAYKYGGTRDREHLFASGSVSKALVRAQYMGFFTRAVRNHVDNLQSVAVKLENSRLALEQSYRQKAEMVREQEQQLKSWASRKNEKEMVLERLQKNKQEYLLQLASVQKKRTQLQSRIESLILAEQRALEAERDRQRKILEARRLGQRLKAESLKAERLQSERHEAERIRLKKEKPVKTELAVKQKTAVKSPEKKSLPSSPNVDFPELDRVSADFDNALGSLPWPVRNGVVAQRFGSVEDKELKIVRTNNGIDISVPVSTQVRAVSGGKVVQIAFLPTFGNIVIIRHPKSYLTVYANLGQLNIVKDELVKSQQLLGVSGKTPEGTSIVHFEIWKGRVKQNPAKWLR
jgi:murein hydrolase activator